nr:MAG TPA: hypothetical protein [Caudoviricetes sp.]
MVKKLKFEWRLFRRRASTWGNRVLLLCPEGGGAYGKKIEI